MSMRRLACTMALAMGLALSAASGAQACVLAKLPPTAERVAGAGFAYAGVVTAVSPAAGFNGTDMTLAVDRVWRGDVPAVMELHSAMTSCAVSARVGQRLALAHDEPPAGRVTVGAWSVIDEGDLTAPVDWARLRIDAALGRRASRVVQVSVGGAGCAGVRFDRALESRSGVRLSFSLRLRDHPPGVSCPAAGRPVCVRVVLRKPLGDRKITDAATGRPPGAGKRTEARGACPRLAPGALAQPR